MIFLNPFTVVDEESNGSYLFKQTKRTYPSIEIISAHTYCISKIFRFVFTTTRVRNEV
jgi:hypothetical protein